MPITIKKLKNNCIGLLLSFISRYSEKNVFVCYPVKTIQYTSTIQPYTSRTGRA